MTQKKDFKKILILLIKHLILCFLILYTTTSLYYDYTHCELTFKNEYTPKGTPYYQEQINGSLRQIEEDLQLTRYNLKLHADYKPIKNQIKKLECSIKI